MYESKKLLVSTDSDQQDYWHHYQRDHHKEGLDNIGPADSTETAGDRIDQNYRRPGEHRGVVRWIEQSLIWLTAGCVTYW